MYLYKTELPKNKSVLFTLTNIYGIGHNFSTLICRKMGVSPNFKFDALTKKQINKLQKIIKILGLVVSSELKKKKSQAFKKLVNIKVHRGLRRVVGLPVRGQRTHTNAKTARKIH